MDQRGGCCIERYPGGAYDVSKVGRIMLRFRPIAPKPTSGSGSLSGGGSISTTTTENSSPSVKTGRGKRRHAVKDLNSNTVNRRNNNCRKRKCSPENTDSGGSVSAGEKAVKTLPLMPEAPDAKVESPKMVLKQTSTPLWLSFGSEGGIMSAPGLSPSGLDDPAAAMGRRVVMASWVKVECVTDTWVVGCYGYNNGLGRTDEERVRSLDLDTCPGFISDSLNRVRWTNKAYKRLVGGEVEEGEGEGEVVAWVVAEEGVALPLGCAAFTCRVRVVTCCKEKSSKTAPCDVWRMDCGGFAWRLDTTAALSLGR
ncbi:hypothetical protein CDL12_25531 [Handroanthus impetiginosus]|uniref:DUF7950 domain-containing protein n=1 Tax=Handroanthus impetiginosus TaxID=429701 RepID=A0A2G9G9H5_9LAMI|nr:hypothetical protein CDL12_25531 [Handroanthus impetiginosus]